MVPTVNYNLATKTDPKNSKDIWEAENIMRKYRKNPNIRHQMDNFDLDSESVHTTDVPSADEFYLVPKDLYKAKSRSFSAIPFVRQPYYVTGTTPLLYTMPANYPYTIPANQIAPITPYSYVPVYPYVSSSTNQSPVISANQSVSSRDQAANQKTEPTERASYRGRPFIVEETMKLAGKAQPRSQILQPIRFYEIAEQGVDYQMDPTIGHDSSRRNSDTRRRKSLGSSDKLITALNKVNRAAENLNKLSNDLNQNMNSVISGDDMY